MKNFPIFVEIFLKNLVINFYAHLRNFDSDSDECNDSHNAYEIDISPPRKSAGRHYHLLPICPQLVDMNFLFQFVIGISTKKGAKNSSSRNRWQKIRNLIRADKKKTNFPLSRFPQCRIIVNRWKKWSFPFSLNRIINEGGSWKLVSSIRVTIWLKWKSIKEWNDFRGRQQERNINDRSFL